MIVSFQRNKSWFELKWTLTLLIRLTWFFLKYKTQPLKFIEESERFLPALKATGHFASLYHRKWLSVDEWWRSGVWSYGEEYVFSDHHFSPIFARARSPSGLASVLSLPHPCLWGLLLFPPPQARPAPPALDRSRSLAPLSPTSHHFSLPTGLDPGSSDF